MSYEQGQNIKEFAKLMEDKQYQAWLKARLLVEKSLKESAQLSDRFVDEIKRHYRKVNSFLMFIYIYSLNIQYQYPGYYKEQLEKERENNSYSYVVSWLQTQNQQNQQHTVQLILQHFTRLLDKKTHMTIIQLCFLIHTFNRFDIKRQRNVNILIDFISSLKRISFQQPNQLLTRQISILRFICAISANDTKGKGNMTFLFDQMLLGQADDKNIDKFCNFYDTFICQFTNTQLLSIFRQISKSGLNFLIVSLIFKISKVLASFEQFFKLKYLYEQYLLTNLIKYGKSCQRDKVSATILSIAELYIVGFLAYCDIGEIGIQCLLFNLGNVLSEKQKKRWVELAYIAAGKGKRQSSVDKYLAQNKLERYIADGKAGKDNLNKAQPWEITARNIKQHKVYKGQESTVYCGIKNRSVQCYIISTVQALFMTKNLQELLKKANTSRLKSKVIDALSNVFDALAAPKKKRISIDDVQRSGPSQFKKSQRQEDAYEYLMALMTQMEKQLKQQNLLDQFKQIFQIQWKSTIICQECKYTKDSIQNTYIHTISNKEKIKLQSEEILTDFSCQNCHKNKCKKTQQINLSSKIFIVHINRFSVSKGVARKELPTEKIIRKINNYSLVGIIFHIGKSVQCGHYVYYSKIDSKRWVQLNDQNVKEFTLDREDEQFERETKAQKTPYILFYKQQK